MGSVISVKLLSTRTKP